MEEALKEAWATVPRGEGGGVEELVENMERRVHAFVGAKG